MGESNCKLMRRPSLIISWSKTRNVVVRTILLFALLYMDTRHRPDNEWKDAIVAKLPCLVL